MICRKLRPLFPEHHLSPALPHFMAERETDSFRIFRVPFKNSIFSTEHIEHPTSNELPFESGALTRLHRVVEWETDSCKIFRWLLKILFVCVRASKRLLSSEPQPRILAAAN